MNHGEPPSFPLADVSDSNQILRSDPFLLYAALRHVQASDLLHEPPGGNARSGARSSTRVSNWSVQRTRLLEAHAGAGCSTHML